MKIMVFYVAKEIDGECFVQILEQAVTFDQKI